MYNKRKKKFIFRLCLTIAMFMALYILTKYYSKNLWQLITSVTTLIKPLFVTFCISGVIIWEGNNCPFLRRIVPEIRRQFLFFSILIFIARIVDK